MEHLWAPWRMEYIRGEKRGGGCIFCFPDDARGDRERLLLEGSRHSILMMNRYPYSNGHLMVAPRRHLVRLDALSVEERLDLMEMLVRAQRLLEEVFRPDGMNIGINLGRVAGAGVEDHLHIHLVPRWNGDTNFMTVLGDVRVIPDHILASYDLLVEKLKTGQTKS
ncbi:MAG: HIT domain-containing protein [Desulfuromonadia bacterium]